MVVLKGAGRQWSKRWKNRIENNSKNPGNFRVEKKNGALEDCDGVERTDGVNGLDKLLYEFDSRLFVFIEICFYILILSLHTLFTNVMYINISYTRCLHLPLDFGGEREQTF